MSFTAMLPSPIRSAIAQAQTPQSRRWIGLIVLLVIEATALSIRFDAGTADQGGAGWGHLISKYFKFIPQVGIVSLLACILTCWVWLKDDLRRELASARDRKITIPVAAHLGLYLLFAGLTWKVVEGGIDSSGMPLFWIGAWALSAVGMLVAWGAAAFPPGFWRVVLQRGSPMIALGMTYALAAVFLARYAGKSWRILAGPTFLGVEQLLRLIYGDVFTNRADFVIGTSRFHVSIAAACSGYQGIGMILMTVSFFILAWRSRLKFPQAFLLIPLGVVAMGISNLVRITALIILGTSFSPEIAMGGFHSQVGWLMFIAVTTGLVLLADQFRFFSRGVVGVSERPSTPEFGSYKYRIGETVGGKPSAKNGTSYLPWKEQPTPAYLAPFIALVGTMMASTALMSGIDWGYPIRVVTASMVLLYFRKSYAKLNRSVSPNALAAGVGVFAFWLVLEPDPETPDAGKLPESMSQAYQWFWIASKIIGSVLIVPIAEEFVFRGYIPRRIQALEFEKVPFDRFDWAAFFASSIAFGILHQRWFAGTLAGMIYYLCMVQRGRLGDAIVAHAVTNALIAAMVLFTGSWYLWS